MDKIAKRELAKAILDTLSIHEASFEQADPRGWGFHRKDLLESAQDAGVDSDLQPLSARWWVSDFPTSRSGRQSFSQARLSPPETKRRHAAPAALAVVVLTPLFH